MEKENIELSELKSSGNSEFLLKVSNEQVKKGTFLDTQLTLSFVISRKNNFIEKLLGFLFGYDKIFIKLYFGAEDFHKIKNIKENIIIRVKQKPDKITNFIHLDVLGLEEAD